jgi:hypothetical protein
MQWVPRIVILGVSRKGREADHSPTATAEGLCSMEAVALSSRVVAVTYCDSVTSYAMGTADRYSGGKSEGA